jgi:hypothetical protein
MNIFKNLFKKKEYGIPKPPKKIPMPPVKPPKEECKYCNDYTQKVYVTDKNKNAWFSLYEHCMEVIDDRENGNILSFKIKYCPMCGKNLGNGF